jgi:molybdenum cofactor cytidylyltransferase
MGRPKPLLPWGDGTLVEAQVAALSGAGVDDVVVVTGHEAKAVEEALVGSGARAVFNPAFAAGRATSVRAGAGAVCEGTELIVVLSVDQPRPAELIRAVIEAHRGSGALVTVPRHAHRRGHPVVFAGVLLAELRQVTEEGEGMRAVRRRHADRTHEVDVDDPRALLDVNTPDAYAEALRAFGLG